MTSIIHVNDEATAANGLPPLKMSPPTHTLKKSEMTTFRVTIAKMTATRGGTKDQTPNIRDLLLTVLSHRLWHDEMAWSKQNITKRDKKVDF
jgi:hypothetical protein